MCVRVCVCGVEWMRGEIKSVCDVWVRRIRCWEELVAECGRREAGRGCEGRGRAGVSLQRQIRISMYAFHAGISK